MHKNRAPAPRCRDSVIGQTTVEMVVFIAIGVVFAATVGTRFIRPVFQRASQVWERQVGEYFKNAIHQKWF